MLLTGLIPAFQPQMELFDCRDRYRTARLMQAVDDLNDTDECQHRALCGGKRQPSMNHARHATFTALYDALG